MPELPLLRLPPPSPAELPSGQPNIPNFRKPTKGRQGIRLGPIFDRLRTVLAREGEPIELRDDPTALAPDRVIVFEIAGTVANFLNALRHVPGLEFMAEIETEFTPDEDFANRYSKGQLRGQDIPDKAVSGRLYLAMPDVQALRQLLSLWEQWRTNQPLGRGLAPIGHLFEQLRDLRPWGIQDRIPADTVAYWLDESEKDPGRAIRTEIELWYRPSEAKRLASARAIRAAIEAEGGQVIHESVIGDVAYHGMLADVPAAYVQRLIDHENVRLAIADEVMFLRPQSILSDPHEIETHDAGVRPVVRTPKFN